MGIRIAAEAGHRTGVDYSTVTIECDGASIFCLGSIAYRGDYMEARRRATAAGWLERNTPESGRLFICRECLRRKSMLFWP